MELSELRDNIDQIDRELIRLLEARMDIAAGVASYKLQHGLPVLDAERESEKLADVKAQCRPETADQIGGLFSAIMAASRAYQTAIMEKHHG